MFILVNLNKHGMDAGMGQVTVDELQNVILTCINPKLSSSEPSLFDPDLTLVILHKSRCPRTVEPRFNEPLLNKVPYIRNSIRQPGQSCSKVYGTKPRYNESWYNTIPDTMNTIQKPHGDDR